MKHLFILGLLAVGLMACNDDSESTETKAEEQKPVELKTDNDKIAYSLGFQRGSSIMSSQNPNRDKFDKKELIAGFGAGFKEIGLDQEQSCMMSIQNMVGGSQGAPFNDDFAKEGCNCIGLLTAADIYKQFSQFDMIDRIDAEKLKRGFSDGLNGVENSISEEEQDRIFQELNTEMMAVQQKIVDARWAEIKAKPGIKELDKGIYLETITEGTGASPKENDDIEASYVLRLFSGMVKETSERLPDGRFQANLHTGPDGLIEGWVIGFQAMKEGGKYRLYLPKEMAYGQEPLDFEIEFFKKGPAGTLKKQMPQMQPPM